MLKEFKAFVMRGNVLDLAVAVIIGAAFGTITTSITEDVIMPVVGAIFGGLDFSSHYIKLAAVPAGVADNYAALKEAGVPVLGWGQFLTVVLNFLILAFIIFMLIRTATRFSLRKDGDEVPPQVQLLTEIRDELRARPRD